VGEKTSKNVTTKKQGTKYTWDPGTTAKEKISKLKSRKASFQKERHATSPVIARLGKWGAKKEPTQGVPSSR